jgi:hypothetical protein
MNLLPQDCLIEIFKNINNQQDLIKLNSISRLFFDLIKTTPWDHFDFRFQNIEYYDYVVDNYNILRWDFSVKTNNFSNSRERYDY